MLAYLFTEFLFTKQENDWIKFKAFADNKLNVANPFSNKSWFLRVCTIRHLKTVLKRRNCSKQAISPFPTVFFTHLYNFLLFSSNLKLSSAYSFSLEESKIFGLGKC